MLADKQLKRYRTVREAVWLMTIMAHVNYDAWIGELRRATRYSLSKWCNIRHERVPRKYCFSFYDGGDDVDVYGWELMQYAFGHAKLTHKFLEDYPQAVAVATAHGFDVATMGSIPIKFRVRPSEEMTKPKQIALLKNLTKTVTQIRKLEDEARGRTDVAGDTIPPPVFRLECIDLDLRKFEFHSTVLKELQRLVETGVCISSLTLPSHGARHSKETDETQMLNWGLFLCAITGQSQPPSKRARARPVQVQRLVVPLTFPSEQWSLPVCSALATAKCIETAKIEHRIIDRTFGNDQSRLWAWMGYGLFRADSATSVETLELTGFKLSTTGLDALSETMQPRDGLDALWRICTEASGSGPSTATGTRSVIVQKGSRARALGFTDRMLNSLKSLVLPCDWEGTVVADDDRTTLDVLLPGLGLCRIDRESISNKRQKTTKASRAALTSADPQPAVTRRQGAITALVLGLRTAKDDSDTVDARPFVPRLCQLVGRPLSVLHIHANGVDAKGLDACLVHCPKLTSLRLNGLSLSTLEPLMRAYQRGAKIASLELRDIKNLPADKFEAFMRFLEPRCRDNAIKTHLRKLRIGKGWSASFRPETAAQMERILRDPGCKLSHVHVYRNCDHRADRPYVGWHIRQYRGASVEPPCFPLSNRLAFLSVLRRSKRLASTANDDSRLNQSLISRVFQCMTAPTRRVVIEDMDTSSGFLGDRISEYENFA